MYDNAFSNHYKDFTSILFIYLFVLFFKFPAVTLLFPVLWLFFFFIWRSNQFAENKIGEKPIRMSEKIISLGMNTGCYYIFHRILRFLR